MSEWLTRVKDFLIWKLFAVYNYWCRWRLFTTLPGVEQEMADYARKSDTTGTKYPTLWRAVSIILSHKPSMILECGTGMSTIVLAAALDKLRLGDPGYRGRIVSMESVESWFEMARKNLPKKYADTVEIVLGPRVKDEFMFFRGYRHSNIPALDYDFVFLDGPDYNDDDGSAFCTDVFHVLETTSAPLVRGVIDTRVSSVYVLQTVFGRSAIRYFPTARTSDFCFAHKPFRTKLTSRDFRSSLLGTVKLRLK